MSGKAQDWARLTRFFARLVRDTRGNTLIIVGAAIIPLLAMIGSGIDLSRTYMAQTRLQQACDAGALAGRRAMTMGTVDDAVRAEALKFFKFNFPTGTQDVDGTAWFGARGFTPTVGSAPNSTVTMSASTQMPLTIMKMFGFAYLPISVACNARLDFVNTDVVLVLDVTASMYCAPSEATCTESQTKTEKTTSKIKALRTSVLSFYDTLKPIQTQLAGVNLRLRYSVVPYSSSVNVGRLLRGVDDDYVAHDKWTYQSRLAQYTHSATGYTYSQCQAVNGTRSNSRTSNGVTTYTCSWTDNVATGNNASWNGQWDYGPVEYDISTFASGSSTPTSSIAGTAVPTPSRTPGTTSNSTWQGCIEERFTAKMSGTATSIPTDAYDLDIDMIPNAGDIRTQWKPYWLEVSWIDDNTNWKYNLDTTTTTQVSKKPQWACPTEAKRLQTWATKTDLSNYLDSLRPDGGTYHDNGMIWGIRMLSSAGVFAADNPANFGGMPVSKYLIFFTDGQFDTGYERLYTTYGLESRDKRVGATSEDDQLARHKNRFNLLCTLAKSRGISVWVVAFAVSLDTSLTNCANKGQASTSASQAELNAKFVEIGQNIGALRLTQ